MDHIIIKKKKNGKFGIYFVPGTAIEPGRAVWSYCNDETLKDTREKFGEARERAFEVAAEN